jgi:diacylglycerol kinase family enzyme
MLKVESESRLQYHLDGEYRELPPGGSLEIEVQPQRLQMIT